MGRLRPCTYLLSLSCPLQTFASNAGDGRRGRDDREKEKQDPRVGRPDSTKAGSAVTKADNRDAKASPSHPAAAASSSSTTHVLDPGHRIVDAAQIHPHERC